jgi:hypothetical protein
VITKRLSRKKRFQIALVALDSSMSRWAQENNVSRTHLYAVLEGERIPSEDLNAKIEAVLHRAQRVA